MTTITIISQSVKSDKTQKVRWVCFELWGLTITILIIIISLKCSLPTTMLTIVTVIISNNTDDINDKNNDKAFRYRLSTATGWIGRKAESPLPMGGSPPDTFRKIFLLAIIIF